MVKSHASAQPVTTIDRVCADEDRDGFGLGDCPLDCDDHDPTVTDACVRCVRPATGCECNEESAPVACDVMTDTDQPVQGQSCHPGARVCRGGHWGRCEEYRSPFQSVLGPVSCNNSCDPDCRHFVDCHESSDAFTTGSVNVRTGGAAPAVFCPQGTGPGGVTGTCTTLGGGPYSRGTSPAAWVDACAAAGRTTALAGSDDGTTTATVPFSFTYFGSAFTAVGISSNGMLSFSTPSSEWENQPTPYAAVPNTIFAFWDDLVQRTGVCIATVGTAPNRRFVVEWYDAGFYPAPSAAAHLTFEAVLNESSNTIDVLYNRMEDSTDRASGSSATIGIQQGAGTAWDQVTYNTPAAVSSGSSVRWTPGSSSSSCTSAVYVRTFTADCAGPSTPTPVWGRVNYTTNVPPGTQIRFEARAAQSEAGLATAVAVRLPNAPAGAPGIPTSVDLGNILFVSGVRHLAHMPVVQITAYLDASSDLTASPTLISLEQQYTCTSNEISFSCRPNSACFNGPCRQGRLDCGTSPPSCVDAGPVSSGTTCGAGLVCNPSGACVACNEGATCDPGNACAIGRISCATGVPVCNVAGARPSGAPCAVSSNIYSRSATASAWLEACGAAGGSTVLAGADDVVTTAAIPFSFQYFGASFTSIGISSNGMLSFGAASTAFANTALPASPANTVFAFWDDLVMRTGVCTATFGAAPNRVFVVEWSNADLYGAAAGTASLTFEAQLEEGTQAVTLVYNTLRSSDDRSSGSSATIGIQRDTGSRFDQVGYNTSGSVRTGSAFRFSPSVTATCNGAGVCQTCSGSEVCDGVDNNCNGLVDDGIPSVTCGVGACQRTVAGCFRGATQACVPGAPTTEACNGVDDNCNGVADEGCTGNVVCPGNLTVAAGTALPVTVTPVGSIVSYAWSIASGPLGGAAIATWSPSPATSASESFRPTIVGVYRLRATGVDLAGVAHSCEFNVNALPHGLRVELTWDGPGDLDLHLHNGNTSTAWGTSDDCHYRNMTPAWGARLDFDNVTANGPENIRIDSPTTGSAYTVAMGHYANGAGRVATVRIYCGDTSAAPVAVFTSRPLAGTTPGLCTNNDFWRVARVNFTSPSACTVTPINTYTPSSNSCSTY